MKKIIFFLLLSTFSNIYSDQLDEINLHENNQYHDLSRVDLPKAPDIATKPADMPAKPNLIWTKPLIIDNNNRDFDSTNIIKFPGNITYKQDPNYNYPWIYINYPAAIIVNKDNIVIDLAGYSLSYQAPATSSFLISNPTYGIAVCQGVKNLKIISSTPQNSNQETHKGSITNFTGFAIFASGSRQSYNNYDIYSLMIKNMMIDNLLITQNKHGIYIENALNPTITNTDVIYNYSPQIGYGIFFSYIFNGLIDGCHVNENWSYTDIFGMYLEDTTNLTVQNSQANSNRSLKSGNATGIVLTASTASAASSDNLIKNCTANRNLCANVSGRSSIGFALRNLSRHNVVQYCTSLNSGTTTNNSIPPLIAPTGVGFQLDSSSLNTISNNTSGFHADLGFNDTAVVSSSFFTSNTSMYNGTNYAITVPNRTGGGASSLAVTNLYSNDTSAATGAGPLYANYSIQATE